MSDSPGIQTVSIVSVLPTKLWAEKDFFGTVKIMRQHEGEKPFCFVEIHYNYAHTSNAHQHELAQQIMALLGGGKPADERQPNGLMFDALGEPRTRYVRVTLNGSHCVMHPSEGDTYIADARAADDQSDYKVADVWLSEREFEDLAEFNGF